MAQSYIKYKGTPEIILNIKTKDVDLFNVGQQVYFDIPEIVELAQDYLVKSKEIEITKTGNDGVVFYTYKLSSNYDSENAINFFDNQRRKANGNIGQGDFITRNIDIENETNIIFDNVQFNVITPPSNYNVLNCILDSPFIQ